MIGERDPGRRTLARFLRQVDELEGGSFRTTLNFPYKDRPEVCLRETYAAIEADLKLFWKPLVTDGWMTFYGTRRDGGLWMDMESGNYGLGFSIERYVLLVAGVACIRTWDREDDNCGSTGGEFIVSACDDAALERVVAVLVSWHAAHSMPSFTRQT